MSLADAMRELLLAFVGDFTVVALVSLSVGVPAGFWLGVTWTRSRDAVHVGPVGEAVTMPLPGTDDEQAWLEQILDEPVFAPGVAKVGDW